MTVWMSKKGILLEPNICNRLASKRVPGKLGFYVQGQISNCKIFKIIIKIIRFVFARCKNLLKPYCLQKVPKLPKIDK